MKISLFLAVRPILAVTEFKQGLIKKTGMTHLTCLSCSEERRKLVGVNFDFRRLLKNKIKKAIQMLTELLNLHIRRSDIAN